MSHFRLIFIATFALLANTSYADQFISIGTCIDKVNSDQAPLRFLINPDNEANGLLVGQVPNPEDPNKIDVGADTLTVTQDKDGSYHAKLSQDSILGNVFGSFEFTVSKNGADWVGTSRTYSCKLDK